MKRWTSYFLIALILASTVGCMSRRYRNNGDHAFASGDMATAVYHYEQALGHRASLAGDSDFMHNLTIARSRVAFDEAERWRENEQYEQAIQALLEAIDQDPSYAAPRELLPVVRAEASVWRYEEAVDAADAGDLDAARDHLNRALRHDPANMAATFALSSLSPQLLDEGTAGLAEYRRGVALSSELRWLEAESVLVEAVLLNPGLLPARAALYDARHEHDVAIGLMQRGEDELNDRQLIPAIRALRASLEVWPFNAEADALLDRAVERRSVAVEQFNLANAAAAEARWDDAIAHVNRALEIDLSDQAFRDLRVHLPGRAADYYIAQGDGHRAAGRLDEAHGSYNRAMDYVREARGALRGMAEVYTAWGAEHESAGRLGAALLYYMRANQFTTLQAATSGIERMTLAVRERAGMTMGLAVRDTQRSGAVEPSMVDRAVSEQLQGAFAAGLAIDDQNGRYELQVSILRSEIDQVLAARNNRTHHYTVCELRHNPEYDRVAAQLRRERDQLCRYEQDLARWRCTTHHHDGICNCHHGSHYRNLVYRVDRQRGVVRDWERRLSRTPRQIEVEIPHTWNYTTETYRVTGLLIIQTQVIDTASGEVIASQDQRAGFSAQDTTVLNANPQIGLYYDALDLPSDQAVRWSLSREAAEDSAGWGLHTAVLHRVETLHAESDALAAQGDAAAALEARVDAAVLLGISDRAAYNRTLLALTREHTR